MNILLPFTDDSSLIFARAVGDELEARNVKTTYALVIERVNVGSKVSDRQMNLYLPKGPDIILEPSDLVSEGLLMSFEAVIMCRLLQPVNQAVNGFRMGHYRRRGCFVAFWAGLDFFPHKGVFNRRNYDLVFLLREGHRQYVPEEATSFYTGVGHPYFILADPPKMDPTGPVLFAAQAISPLTLAGRVHMINLMVATALANPDREIVVKLRHKSDENRHHAHKEVFSYEDLAHEMYPRLPQNLLFSYSSMAEALEGAGGCIACTSTAVIDSLAAGVPSLIYLSYPGAHDDPLCEPMRQEFHESGLIGTDAQVLSLEFSKPNHAWMNDRFSRSGLYEEMLLQIVNYHRARTSRKEP